MLPQPADDALQGPSDDASPADSSPLDDPFLALGPEVWSQFSDNDPTPPQPSDPEQRGIFKLSAIRTRPLAWLWRGRIPFGKLTLLEGDPGLGKSTLIVDLAARITTARPLPDDPTPLDAPGSVILVSAEDGAADTIRPRLEAAGGNPREVFVWSHLPEWYGGGLPTLPRYLGWVEQMIDKFHPCLLVFDPLVAYLGPKVNANSDQGIRRALAPLASLAERSGIAIVAIRHLTKRASRNPLYRGGGSIGFVGSARSALLIAPDPDDPSRTRRVLASTKSNLGPPPASLAYRLVTAPNGAAAVAWEGLSEHTAATLVAGEAQPDDTSSLLEATAVLRAILADGPVPARAVHQQAIAAGLAPRTLHRAKAALRVRSRKLRGPAPSGHGWVWELPTDGRAVSDQDCQGE